jgi:hypothetical protein
MKDFFRFVVTFNSFGLHLKTISIRKLVVVSIWRLKGRGATCCAQRQLQFPVIDAAKASALPLANGLEILHPLIQRGSDGLRLHRFFR